MTDYMKLAAKQIEDDVTYYKKQMDGSRWALEKPKYESIDDYQCRCDALHNYYDKRDNLKNKYDIDYK